MGDPGELWVSTPALLHSVVTRVWSLAIGRRVHPWRDNNVGGVTAGQTRHNSSNVGGVTAGQVRHNSRINKI